MSQAGKSTRIAAGNYVVEVDQAFDGAAIVGGHVSMKRGDTETVKITMKQTDKTFAGDGLDTLRGFTFQAKGKNGSESSNRSPEFPPVKISVVDEEYKPVVGAKVFMNKLHEQSTPSVVANGITAENGSAIDRAMPFGDYFVRVVYTINTATGEHWTAIRSKIVVEFDKGLDLTFVAPSSDGRATLVLDSNLDFAPDAIAELRFGGLEEHTNGTTGWGAVRVPEPDVPAENQSSSPTLGNGIQEIAVGLHVNINRTTKQANGEELTWSWSPRAAQVEPFFLDPNLQYRMSMSEICQVIGLRQEHASRQENTRYFNFDSTELFTVAAQSVQVGEPSRLPLSVNIPAGRLGVYVTDIYGRPTAEVLESLGLKPSEDTLRQVWLTAPMSEDSQWIPRLLDVSNWESYSKHQKNAAERIVYFGYVLQQTHSVKPGESLRVSFRKPSDTGNVSDALDRELPNTLNPKDHSQPTTDDPYLHSLTEILQRYNEATKEARQTRFNPPIPDLELSQLVAAVESAAKDYRKSGKHTIADALQNTAKSGRLDERLFSCGLPLGTLNRSPETGDLTFQQFLPHLECETGFNSRTIVALSGAELRWSRDGWSSPGWGKIHQPITGEWLLSKIMQKNESFGTAQFDNWKDSHSKWSRLVIEDASLVMAGTTPEAKFDLALDYHGVVPTYQLSSGGEVKFSGIFMGNIDDTELVVMVALDGSESKKTFRAQDNDAVALVYHRVPKAIPVADQQRDEN